MTRRTAMLLRFPADAAARVRLKVLPAESHAAADALPGAPKLELTTAPVGVVQQSDLPPPEGEAPAAAASPPEPQQEAAPVAVPIARLPELVTQGTADPGQLFIRLGTFQTYQYAGIQRSRVAGLAPPSSARARGGRRCTG